MTNVNTLTIQSNILKSRQSPISVTEYIACSDRRVLNTYFGALHIWFSKIKNTGLIIENLEDFVKIVLDKETGIRKHLEISTSTNSKSLRDNFKQLKYSLEKLESYKFAVRAIDQRYHNTNRYKNTEVEAAILAWCFENYELVKPFFDAYVSKYKNVEPIINSIISDEKLVILKPLILELKQVIILNEKLFLNYDSNIEFERFIYQYQDPDLAYKYCDLQEYVLGQTDYEDYGVARIINNYGRRYGEFWIVKYALSLFRYYAKSEDLNYQCLGTDSDYNC